MFSVSMGVEVWMGIFTNVTLRGFGFWFGRGCLVESGISDMGG